MFENDWKALELAELPAKQQARIARNVKRGDVSSVLPMIVLIADRSWGMLPPHTRQWFTKQEAIAAGVAFTVTEAAKEFDSKRTNKETGAPVKFSSFLYERLTQFFITRVAEPLLAAKRCEGTTVSFDSSLIPFKLGGVNKAISAEFYIAHTMKAESPANEIINRVDAQKHFLQVYTSATPNLRKYLIKWFLTSKVVRMREGAEYHSARKELKTLALRHGFTCAMAIFLANNDIARANTALAVLQQFRTNQYVSRPSLKHSLEKDVVSTAVMADRHQIAVSPSRFC